MAGRAGAIRSECLAVVPAACGDDEQRGSREQGRAQHRHRHRPRIVLAGQAHQGGHSGASNELEGFRKAEPVPASSRTWPSASAVPLPYTRPRQAITSHSTTSTGHFGTCGANSSAASVAVASRSPQTPARSNRSGATRPTSRALATLARISATALAPNASPYTVGDRPITFCGTNGEAAM